MKEPKGGREPGEDLVAVWWANHTQHSQRAVGGRLFLTDRRLLFEPHAVDAGLAGRSMAVRLADIRDVTRVPPDLSHFFGGGLRSRMAVTLRDGSTNLFVVNGMKDKIRAIDDQRRAP